ncbi:hypothetical protein MD484_g8392, partial [Candolleomyces efflorescens]
MPPQATDDDGGSDQRPASPTSPPTTSHKRGRSPTPYYPRKTPRLSHASTPLSASSPPSPTVVTSTASYEAQFPSSQSETIIPDSEEGYSELEEDACLAYLTDEASEQASSEPDAYSEPESDTSYKKYFIVDPSTGYTLPLWHHEFHLPIQKKPQRPASSGRSTESSPVPGQDQQSPSAVPTTPKSFTFTRPPPDAPLDAIRAPIQPIRLSEKQRRPPPTPYVKRTHRGNKECEESPTPASSSVKHNPFAVLEGAWERRRRPPPAPTPASSSNHPDADSALIGHHIVPSIDPMGPLTK